MSTLFLLLLIAASSIQGSVSERHFFSQIYFPAYLIASTSSTTSSLCHKRDFFRTLLCLQANFRSGNSKQVDSTSSTQLFAVDTQLENSTDLEGDSQNIIEIEVANQKKVSALLKSLLPVLSDKANPRAFLLDVFVPWCSTCQKIKPLIGTAARLLSKIGVAVIAVDGSQQEQDQDGSEEWQELQTVLQYSRQLGYPALYLQYRQSDHSLNTTCYDGNWDLLELLGWIEKTLPPLNASSPLSTLTSPPSAELLQLGEQVRAHLRQVGVPLDREDDDDCDSCSL